LPEGAAKGFGKESNSRPRGPVADAGLDINWCAILISGAIVGGSGGTASPARRTIAGYGDCPASFLI
jgi:predicted aminopeptidase